MFEGDQWWHRMPKPPHLVKFCRPEHNIASDGTHIRIGTLEEYRKIENSEIRDESEGVVLFSFKFPQLTPVSKLWLRQIKHTDYGDQTPEPIARARGTIFTENMTSQRHPDSRKISVSGRFHAFNIHKNCYILSLSWQNQQQKFSPFSGYSSAWTIIKSQHQNFFKLLRSLMEHKIRCKPWFTPTMKCKSYAFPVIYVENWREITSEHDLSVERANYLFDNAWRVKSEDFKKEREFRFMLCVTDGRRTVAVPPEPIYINASLLKGYTEVCAVR